MHRFHCGQVCHEEIHLATVGTTARLPGDEAMAATHGKLKGYTVPSVEHKKNIIFHNFSYLPWGQKGRFLRVILVSVDVDDSGAGQRVEENSVNSNKSCIL